MIANQTVFAQPNCDDVGNDGGVADSEISNLRQAAANADIQASMARNLRQQQRWANEAQSLRDQAAALQAQETSTNDAERQLCNTLTNRNSNGN